MSEERASEGRQVPSSGTSASGLVPTGGPEGNAPRDPECLFCKIAAGEVPAAIVRETESTLAFRDINPQAPCHVLVMPKAHYPDAGSLAARAPLVAAEMLREAAAVAVDEKVDDTGYRVVMNTGSGAGQTVWHTHAHVLGGRGFNWPPG